MTRRETILAAMAPAKGAPYSPVRIQKLLFLIDRECPDLISGPSFTFEPYNYGPFDKTVYQELDALKQSGHVTVCHDGWTRTFALTPIGQAEGDRLLHQLDPSGQQYFKQASAFVLAHGFSELVSAIYKAYPAMQANSIFSD